MGEVDNRKPLTAFQARKHRDALLQGREEGFQEALEGFVPHVVEVIRRRQELMPKVLAVVEGVLDSRDGVSGRLADGAADDLKAVTPLLKGFFEEDKRLVDRLFGGSVQRQKQDVTRTEVHVSLRDLLAGGSSVSEFVVDAEVVE